MTAAKGQETRRDLTAFAAASLIVAVVAAIIRAAEPFDHGIWLVAYLFLVGYLAQFLLGRGQAALLAASDRTPPPPRVRRAQLVLWNIGVVAVPFGVIVGARLAVVIGALGLLVALVSFSESVRAVLRAHPRSRRWLTTGYVALLAFMATGALVGTALAWDIEWL